MSLIAGHINQQILILAAIEEAICIGIRGCLPGCAPSSTSSADSCHHTAHESTSNNA
ncbi:hypothetical protein [Dryocola sp. BD613]|uniref:hypothetical protein n=1 Tax=Dryocola sp. BD613 TaxID=3133272 RepID=UPI003F4FB7D8